MMNTEIKLTRRYIFFTYMNGEYRVAIPNNMDEYIRYESKTKPGAFCIQYFEGESAFARVKNSNSDWVGYYEPRFPPEIRAYLAILGITMSTWY